MSRVITVMNMKGGVGKTTVSANAGGALAVYRLGNTPNPRKVLLIDYDPQFNLSQCYIPAKSYFALDKERKTVIAVLQDSGVALDPYKLQLPGTATPPSLISLVHNVAKYRSGSQLDIVPSTLDLMYVALGRTDSQVDVIEERFAKFIGEARQGYDVILIDCHPAGSLMTKTALTNSDHVLIPVAPERYAVRGIGLMLDFIKSKKHGAVGPTAHILFNRVPRIGHRSEEVAIRTNPRYAGLCLDNTLKKYSAFSDPEEGRGFVWYSSKPYSTEASRNLAAVAAEFAQRIGV